MVSIGYHSCKKIDNIKPGAQPEINIEEAFFTRHRSADAQEKQIVDYLQRQNSQLRFVGKTVSQIGYPYWNKAISVRQKNNSLTGRNPVDDSTTLFYIPFVRDSQHYVNASMVVEVSATDTGFWYLCDWQYRYLSNDSLNLQVDKAEKLALFFMIMDKEVFGHKKFNVTDNTLFNDGNAIAKKVQLDTVPPNPVSGRNNYIFQCQNIAITLYKPCQFERSVTAGYTNREGWPKCPYTQWVMLCWYELDIGGSPETGGGGGGNPGGGGTPPDCGGASGGRIAARGDLPCIEDPGWEPEPLDPFDDYNPLIADTIIVDTSIINNYPCTNSLLNSLPNTNRFTQQILHHTFGVDTYVNLIFAVDNTLTSTQEDAYTQPMSFGIDSSKSPKQFLFSATIFLNPWVLKNSTKEYVVGTILHEAIHGYIEQMFYRYSLGQVDSQTVKNSFPIFWDFFTNPYTPTNQYLPETTEHNIIASNYTNNIAAVIKAFYSDTSATIDFKDSISKALSWGGLTTTNVWYNKTMFDKCNIATINLAARDTSLYYILPQGNGLNCGGLNTNYSTLKLSKPCP